MSFPDPATWVQLQIQRIYTAKTVDEFKTAFNSFVGDDVSIKVNGKNMSRDQYKKQLQGERFLERSATVNVLNEIQAPKLNAQLSQACDIRF